MIKSKTSHYKDLLHTESKYWISRYGEGRSPRGLTFGKYFYDKYGIKYKDSIWINNVEDTCKLLRKVSYSMAIINK